MEINLLKEYVQSVIVERRGDVESLTLAKHVFDETLKFLKNMQGKGPRDFDEYFDKENGRYTTLYLKDVLNLPELKDISLVIKDRETFDVRKGLKALSSREMTRIHRKGGGYKRKYSISIFVDIDRKQNWSAYNKSFRDTLYDKFVIGDNWEHFAHEFTHILDFQRQEDKYLFARAEKLKKRKEKRQEDEDAYLNTYVNDPGESNAYIRQSLSRVMKMIQDASSKEEVERITGKSQKEFVDKFMKSYLVKIARKRFNDDNKMRAVKRAMSFYDNFINDKFIKTQ